MPGKGKKLTEQQVDQHMDTYSKYMPFVDSMLTEAFEKWDSRTDVIGGMPFVDRAEHIIINGRLASEILSEQFEKKFQELKKGGAESSSRPKMFGNFRQQEGNALINQMVSAALANGGQVDVFVPDAQTGRIKEAPVRLKAMGYETLSPMARPAQLSRWKRFWGKLGFYKQERENYRQALQSYEAQQKVWDKVRYCNETAQVALATNVGQAPSYIEEIKKFAPKMLEEMNRDFPNAGGDPAKLTVTNGFATERGSFYSLAIVNLANQKGKDGKFLYTTEQLFDMQDPKMQKARAESLKEVYDHYKVGGKIAAEREQANKDGRDYEPTPQQVQEAQAARDWLCEMQYAGCDSLSQRIDEMAGKLDFNKPVLAAQKGFREFALLCDTAFDQSQDINGNEKRINELHSDVVYGTSGAYGKAVDKIAGSSQFYRRVHNSMAAQRAMMNGYVAKDRYALTGKIGEVMECQALKQHIIQSRKADPKKSMKDILTSDAVMNSVIVKNEASYDRDAIKPDGSMPNLMAASVTLAEEYLRDPAAVSGQVASGVMENRLKTTKLALETCDVEFKVEDAANVEREMKQPEKTGAEAQMPG